MRIPDFFIAGAPRCGTTSLFDYLGQHPEIFASRAKEIHYFGSDLHHIGRRPLPESEYLANFTSANEESRVGEASTSYFYSERAAEEIKSFNPEARIIIMLRNPVDMMYSLYNLNRWIGAEHQPTFESALAAENRRRSGEDLPGGPVLVEGLFYRRIAAFSQHVQRYFDVFGRNSVRVIIFDDFAKDVSAAYEETLRFLEVNPSFQPEFRVLNTSVRPRSQHVQRLVQHPPGLMRSLVRVALPQRLRDALSQSVRRLNAASWAPLPPDPRLRSELQSELEPDVRQLSELLDRDLSHWFREHREA